MIVLLRFAGAEALLQHSETSSERTARVTPLARQTPIGFYLVSPAICCSIFRQRGPADHRNCRLMELGLHGLVGAAA